MPAGIRQVCKLVRQAEHQNGGNSVEMKCVLCVKGIAAPQRQLTIAVQCFSAARPFSFSRENRNSDSCIKFRKHYVDQESTTVARYGSQVISFQLCVVYVPGDIKTSATRTDSSRGCPRFWSVCSLQAHKHTPLVPSLGLQPILSAARKLCDSGLLPMTPLTTVLPPQKPVSLVRL